MDVKKIKTFHYRIVFFFPWKDIDTKWNYPWDILPRYCISHSHILASNGQKIFLLRQTLFVEFLLTDLSSVLGNYTVQGQTSFLMVVSQIFEDITSSLFQDSSSAHLTSPFLTLTPILPSLLLSWNNILNLSEINCHVLLRLWNEMSSLKVCRVICTALLRSALAIYVKLFKISITFHVLKLILKKNYGNVLKLSMEMFITGVFIIPTRGDTQE